jgi:WD40 repeat protein
LAALVMGRLPTAQEEEITRHLEACAACEAQFQALEGATDPVIAALREPKAPSLVSPVDTTIRAATPPVVPADTGPFQIEGYRILKEIGRGGMGVVYLAQQHRLNRLVALKMILAGHLAGAEDRVRFLLEGELLARLNHPNFVQVYEVGTIEISPGVLQPYLVLEHIDGGNLKGRLAKAPPSFREAAELMLVLARAMAVAHAQGIIHRDLKPANVLISRDGTLKITDFGLAKELGGNSSLTPTGLTVGTPSYMAPEQARGAASAGPAADVYALGAILYELLAGRPPFAADTPVDVILQVLEKTPAAVTSFRADVPRDLETICLKCLEKDPRSRYARAADLATDLQAWLDDRPIQARSVGRLERAGKWARRHPLPAALLVLTILSLVGGSGFSTYFGLAAVKHARETEKALGLEAEARRSSDHQTAELQLVAGQDLAEAGEIDHGMFQMLRALDKTPPQDAELRHLIHLNLEAWLPYLPRLRWYSDAPASHQFSLQDKEVLRYHTNKLWRDNAQTGDSLGPPLEFPGNIISWNPDARRVCTRNDEDGVLVLRVFDCAGGAPLGPPIEDRRNKEFGPFARGSSYGVQFSADGELLAAEVGTNKGGERRVWEVATGRALGPPVLRGDASTSDLLRAPGGRCYWLFLRSSGAEVVDVRTGESLGGGPDCLPADVERPAWLFPERQLVQRFLGRHIFSVWDLHRAAPAQPERRLSEASIHYHLARDGRGLVQLFTENRAGWHDLVDHQPYLPTAGLGRGGVSSTEWITSGPDGHRCLVTWRNRPGLKCFDFPHLLLPRRPGASHWSTIAPGRLRHAGATFSPDRQQLLLRETARIHGSEYARMVKVANQSLVGPPLLECDGRAVFSPTGRLVTLATWDRPSALGTPLLVRVFDARTLEPRSPAWTMDYYIHALEFSPDEKYLAIGHVGGATVCALDNEKPPLQLVQPGPIQRLRFSPDSRRLALCGRAGWDHSKPGVQVWDVATGKALGERLASRVAPLFLDAEQADGFLTLDLDTGRLRRWDFAKARAVEDLGVLADWPGQVGDGDGKAFDASRRRLAVGLPHGAIYQWDLGTLKRLAPVAQLKQPIRELAYSPDGRWLASADADGTVALFDPLLGRRAGPLLTHTGPLAALVFRPDSRQLLSVTSDGESHYYEVSESQPLSAAQWQTWLEAATGLRLEGEALLPLGLDEYRARRAAAQELALPLVLPEPPPARWHAEEGRCALQAGQLNAARWHLDRVLALEPDNWLAWASRARVHALEGNAEQSEKDLARATALGPDGSLRDWQRHQAVVDRITGRAKAAR